MYTACNSALQEPAMLNFNPTESTGFLVGRVAHAIHLKVQEFLDETGIEMSAEELSILTVVAHLDGPETMKNLAGLCGRNATTVSRQVSSLEKAGYVNRSPCPDDGRAFVVSVTAPGKRLVKKTIPMTLDLRKRAMQGISAADAQVVQVALQQILENLSND